MKIYCSKSDLNRSLSHASHAVPTRTTTKILECILVDIKDQMMYLTATDTNITIQTALNVTAEGDCTFAVPSKLFSSIISKLPESEIMLDFDSMKSKLKIKSGRSVSEIVCFEGDEFPKIRTKEPEIRVSMNKESVKRMIRKTAFSASADEINGILTGVLFEFGEGNIRMVAVDAFRMAINNEPAEGMDQSFNVVIPAKMLTEVSKIISDDGDETLQMEIADKKAILIFDNCKVTVNTLSGKYIDYKRIISAETPTKIRVKREDLIASIDRASLLASATNNNMIKFNIEEDTIHISSLSDEGNIDESVEVIHEGNDFQIGFNARYLMDIFRNIDDEEIMLNMKDSISPCIVRPLSGERYQYLVLPIRIN